MEIKKYVFGPDWFDKHQSKLLRLANSFIGRRFFRIHGKRSELGKNKINQIGPNFIEWQNKDGSFTREVRIHNKFSKRLYYTLYPVWYTMHTWDMAIANVFAPQLNLGFDTLTIYPDTGTGQTTVDGVIGRLPSGTGEVFSTIRTGAGTNLDTSSAVKVMAYLLATSTTNNFGELDRSIFTFDTSSLPTNITLTSASFNFWGNTTINGLGATSAQNSVALVSSSPASNNNLAIGDFTSLGTTRFATDLAISSVITTGYNSMSLNASGLANVNIGGISKFGARLAMDLDNSAPPWVSSAASGLSIDYSDSTGAYNDPKLILNYTTPGNTSAGRQAFYTNDLTSHTMNSSTYTTTISLNYTPNANTTYYYFSSVTGWPGSSNTVDVRLQNTTGGTTLSEQMNSENGFADKIGYPGFSWEAFGASPAQQTIALQVATGTNGANITTQYAHLLVLQATANDQTASSDANSTVTNNTWTDKTTLTFTPGSAGLYYIFAFAEIQNTSHVGDRYGAQALWGTKVIGQTIGYNYNATSWDPFFSMSQVYLPATSQTFKIQFQNFSNAGDTITIRRARILAIPASVFAQSSWAEIKHVPDDVASTTSATYSDLLTNSFTPTVDGKNWVTIFATTLTTTSTSVESQAKMFSGATLLSELIREPDNTANAMPFMVPYYGALTGAQTFKQQKAASGSTGITQDVAILSIQVDAGGGQSNSVKANILVTTPQNESTKADILVTATQNTSAKANVLITNNTQAESVKADIKVTATQNLSTLGNILGTPKQNNSAVGNILVTNNTQNNSAKANIITPNVTQGPLSVKADIKITALQINSVKADIDDLNTTQNNSAKANVLITGQTQNVSVKADIDDVGFGQINSARADILRVANVPLMSGGNSIKYVHASSQYLSIATGTNIPISNQAYSIVAFVKPTAMNASYGIIGWGNFGTTNAVTALRLSTTGIYHYWWANDLSVNTSSLADGNWHVIVAEFDGTTRSVWLDGVSKGSDTPVGHVVPNTSAFTIGNSNGTEYFDGQIGPIAIYNRAINSTEINNAIIGALPSSGLVALWKGSEGSGATVADSASGNTAILTNSPTWQSLSAPAGPNAATANIFQINTFQNNSVKANILVTANTQNNSVKSDIKVTSSQNLSIKGNIMQVFNTSAKANILITNNTQNTSVKADVLVTAPQNTSVKAAIVFVTFQANSVKANILQAGFGQATSIKADVLRIGLTQNTSVKSDILVITPQALSIKADIKLTTLQANSVKANILIVDNIQGESVKMYIVGARPNQVKADIFVANNTQDTSVKANFTTSGGIDNSVIAHIQRSPMNKTYEYRVYDSTGNTYISTWSVEVLTDPNFRTVINGGPGEMIIQLARKFDDFGEGKDVNLDNVVQCWCFDNQAPNGVMIYAGYISGYRPIFDGGSSTGVDEYIEITLLHEVARLSSIILHDNTQATYISMSGVDPSQMYINSLQYAQADGSLVKYTAGSVTMTNTSQVYIFNAQTVKDAFDRIIELTPIYWYWTIDASNLLQVHQSNLTVATHTFLPGKDIVSMDTWRRTEDMVNTVYFIGAGTPPLYYLFKNNGSISAYGVHAIKIADTRVKQFSTALAMAQREIDTKKDPEIRTTLTIADNNGINVGVGYDIESIQVGQTLRIRNLKQGKKTISYWDQLTWDQDVWDQTLSYAASDILQIQAIEYTPDYVNIEASSRQPEITRRIEQVYRDTSQAIESDVGTTPSTTTQV